MPRRRSKVSELRGEGVSYRPLLLLTHFLTRRGARRNGPSLEGRGDGASGASFEARPMGEPLRMRVNVRMRSKIECARYHDAILIRRRSSSLAAVTERVTPHVPDQ